MTAVETPRPQRNRRFGRVQRLSVDERAGVGRAARAAVPRSSHAAWEPAGDREDPVQILERQAQTRVPQLVPIRYGRMLTSPLAFYRGGAAIMAADLATAQPTGLEVQLCGDAHLSNFGSFAGPDRRLLFDVNDFDETLPGPFEWDVKRLAASIEIAGRHRAFSSGLVRGAVLSAVGAYRRAVRGYAEMRTLDVWYDRMDVEEIARAWKEPRSRKDVDRYIEKSRRKDSLRALTRLTEMVDGEPRFLSDAPLLMPISEILPEEEYARTEEILRGWLRDYRASVSPSHRRLIDRFRFSDLAHKVVGVGSVGTRAWVILMLGRDESDPLVLQVKEAQASVLEPYLGASAYKEGGRRVVEGQRLMQAASDIFLGWVSGTGLDGVDRDFYVRQLWDAKNSIDVDRIDSSRFLAYGELCGRTLARTHARSGDPVALGAYLGNGDRFDQAIATFAGIYAELNDADYARLAEAAESGEIDVRRGL